MQATSLLFDNLRQSFLSAGFSTLAFPTIHNWSEKKIKFADDGDDDDIYGGVDNYDGDNDGDVDDNDDVGGGDDGFSGKVRRLLHHHQCLCSGQNSQV